MLHSRIALIRSYLELLPPSYLNNDTGPTQSDESDPTTIGTSYPILRSIYALTSRLSLLAPASATLFETESKAEKNDVNLMNLLGSVGMDLSDAKEAGKKFQVVENAKQSKEGANLSFQTGGGGGGMDDLRGSGGDLVGGGGQIGHNLRNLRRGLGMMG